MNGSLGNFLHRDNTGVICLLIPVGSCSSDSGSPGFVFDIEKLN